MKKILIWFLIPAGLFIFFLQMASAEEEFMAINSELFGKHSRPIVIFPHILHEDCINCMECHHDFDESGENVGGFGGYCSDCHTKKGCGNCLPLMDAFHIQCKQCHAKEKKKGNPKHLPQMCGDCHDHKNKKLSASYEDFFRSIQAMPCQQKNN